MVVLSSEWWKFISFHGPISAQLCFQSNHGLNLQVVDPTAEQQLMASIKEPIKKCSTLNEVLTFLES